ncbi:hypothetical protein [uncultured Ligilactobacillus sp.]|uniref:hypothetical protein n=1 Tax=uncultured Ligilactobacillus sp. TaxID=2837633 RepID=UPI00272D98AE|nr:hypothetical protein [uncultured Ligilactobacillus sp.]
MSVLLVVSTLLYLTDLRLHQATTQAYLQVQVAQKLLVQSRSQTTKAKGGKIEVQITDRAGHQITLELRKD